MNALKIFSTVIAAVVPLLYFHGQAFHQGWLMYWGMPTGLFPIGMEETLLNGFLAYSILALKYLILIFVYLLAAVATLYNVHEISKLSWVNKLAGIFKTNKDKQQIMGHPAIAMALARTAKVTMLVFSVAMFLFLVLSVSGPVSNLGKESAENKYQELLHDSQKTTFSLGGKKITGNIILCSIEHCGILTENRVLLMPVNDSFQATWSLNMKSED